ncbi:MAG: OsmC family protein [Thermoplasmata archaeon]
MSEREHRYQVEVTWSAKSGAGTTDYRSYHRDHHIRAPGKVADIPASSVPMFRGDASRYNPEELLVAALSSCHMLWMLHLSAEAGIVVVEYTDQASGVMTEEPGKGGRFTAVTLRPRMWITERARVEDARGLHPRAHQLCFIANSVNFPVQVDPVVDVRES